MKFSRCLLAGLCFLAEFTASGAFYQDHLPGSGFLTVDSFLKEDSFPESREEQLCQLWKVSLFPIMHRKAFPELFQELRLLKILHAGAGQDRSVSFMATELFLQPQDFEVWSTDISWEFPEFSKKDNHIRMRLDHSQEPAFPPEFFGKFDLIVMRSGLCLCQPLKKKPKTCGGISHSLKGYRTFFLGVLKSLSSNPQSLAVLEGQSSLQAGQETSVLWSKAATEALELSESGFTYKIVVSPEGSPSGVLFHR